MKPDEATPAALQMTHPTDTTAALRDLLDIWHGGHLQVRPEASGAWHAAVQAGEAALASSSAPAAVVPVVEDAREPEAIAQLRHLVDDLVHCPNPDDPQRYYIRPGAGLLFSNMVHAVVRLLAQAPQPAPAAEPAAPEPRIWWKTGEEGEFMMSPHLPGATERYLADGWRPTYDATPAQPVAAPSAPVQEALPDDLEFLTSRVAYWEKNLTEHFENAGPKALISFVVSTLANRDAAERYTPQPSAQEAPREAVSDEQIRALMPEPAVLHFELGTPIGYTAEQVIATVRAILAAAANAKEPK